jgi:hypothetical protein
VVEHQELIGLQRVHLEDLVVEQDHMDLVMEQLVMEHLVKEIMVVIKVEMFLRLVVVVELDLWVRQDNQIDLEMVE